MSKLYITSSQIHDNLIDTCYAFSNEYPEIANSINDTLILGVARGGLLQAQYLSYYLKNRNLETVSSRLYDDMVKNTGAHTIKGLENINLRRYKNILIVDDIYDTGETIEKITKAINEEAPYVNIIRVVTYSKKEADALIIGQSITHNEWLVFPWDLINKEEEND